MQQGSRRRDLLHWTVRALPERTRGGPKDFLYTSRFCRRVTGLVGFEDT